MTPSEIVQYRLLNQQIASDRSPNPTEVVATLGAMQAQDYAGALWAIGLRSGKSTESGIERVEQAIADRSIIRTWPMRGTLHFVAAPDVRWMLELLTPRVIAGTARRQQQLELDDTVFARCRKLFIRALQGGRQLTRDAMHQLLERARISTASQRGYHILWRLSQDRVICFGAREAGQQTFALLDEWAPQAQSMKRDKALAELARRYFTSHGPATLQDFVWWSGLKVQDARAGIESVAAQLGSATVDRATYWMPRELPDLGNVPPAAYLLPGFDEYLLGYKDRSAALDPKHAQRIVPGSNGMFLPTIVINGRVVGTWKRTLKKKSVTVTASPFTSLKRADARTFSVAADRYGQFLGMSAEYIQTVADGTKSGRLPRVA